MLENLPPVTVRLRGLVWDGVASRGVTNAEVILAALGRTRTDAGGRFETPPLTVRPGHYMALVHVDRQVYPDTTERSQIEAAMKTYRVVPAT